MQISTAGVVIRDYKHDDNRILTILTEDLGVITAFASNAKRIKSPLAGATELLCYSNFIIFKNKGRYVIDAADSNRIFFGIRSRFEDLSLASYFAQLSEELAPKEENAKPFVQLLVTALHYIENQTRDPRLIKAVFELRLLTLAGYMPDLVGCSVCGCYEQPKMYFSIQGGLVCADCYGQCDPVGLVTIPAGVLQAMRHILYAEPQKLFNFSLSEKGLKTLSRLCEQYLIFQLEKSLPALQFYKSIVEFDCNYQPLPPKE